MSTANTGEDTMEVPDFLVIGAAKAGTTTIYHCLDQHPEVCVTTREEPHFFSFRGQEVAYEGTGDDWLNRNAVTDRHTYRSLFERPDRVTGAVSPWSIYTPEAPENLRELRPDVTLIAILRHPVDRAYSSYMHLRRDGREPMGSFEEALAAEEERIEQNWAPIWHYTRASRYGRQLERYQWFIERGQLNIFLFERLKDDTDGLIRDIYDCVGVDNSFEASVDVYNKSGLPYSRALHRFLRKSHPAKELLKPLLPASWRPALARAVKQANLRPSAALDASMRRRLMEEVFADDVRLLEALVDRDLSHWW